MAPFVKAGSGCCDAGLNSLLLMHFRYLLLLCLQEMLF